MDARALVTDSLELQGHGGDGVSAYYAAPADADEAPAVLLVHEVFGLDAHIRDVARRFASEGFCVLAPDLYSREGVPGPASTQDDPAPAWSVETIRSAASSLPDRRALADLDAGAALLAGRAEVDAQSIAVVGFCMGGTLAFLLGCTSRSIAAVVDFYGRPLYRELSEAKPSQPIELALNLDRPLLAFFGAEDQSIPADDIERLRAALSAASKDFAIDVMPGCGHGFFNDLRSGYDETSARAAWQRTLSFLHEVL